MSFCKKCGCNIPTLIECDGVQKKVSNKRVFCFECSPFQKDNMVKKPKICKKCGNKFPMKMWINGKKRNLRSRKYCFDCSPFGYGNTRDLVRLPNNLKCIQCSKPLVGNQTKYCSKKCKDKQMQYLQGPDYYRERRYKAKRRAVEYLGGVCTKCNKIYDVASYDFHHIIQTDDNRRISTLFTSTWDKLKYELGKCVLVCANCHGEIHVVKKYKTKMSLYQRRNKQKAVELLGGSCKCGYNKCLNSLAFHHPNKNKEKNVSNLVSRKWERFKIEVEKCILFCTNCHRAEHKTDQTGIEPATSGLKAQ